MSTFHPKVVIGASIEAPLRIRSHRTSGSSGECQLKHIMTLLPKDAVFFCCLAISLIAVPRVGHAYIDPGSGAMVLQLLFGGIAGALVVGKLYWQKIVALVRRTPKEPKKSAHNR